jgi:hypothetical protein
VGDTLGRLQQLGVGASHRTGWRPDKPRATTGDRVFVTGGTGYIGRPLIDALIERGYQIHALVRPGSEAKLPGGALPVIGNALEDSTFDFAVPQESTVVHLVGTPHPRSCSGDHIYATPRRNRRRLRDSTSSVKYALGTNVLIHSFRDATAEAAPLTFLERALPFTFHERGGDARTGRLS